MMTPVPPKQDFFADFSSLTDLKTKAKQDPDAALQEVAQQFESIFINMMLKNMRSTNEAIGDGLFSSTQTKQYQEMMDSQMAQSMAKSGGIGLADALVRQYQSQQQNRISLPDSSSADDTEFLNQLAKQDMIRIQALAKRASSEFIESIQQEDQVSDTQQVNKPSALSVVFRSPQEFVDTLWPPCSASCAKTGC